MAGVTLKKLSKDLMETKEFENECGEHKYGRNPVFFLYKASTPPVNLFAMKQVLKLLAT